MFTLLQTPVSLTGYLPKPARMPLPRTFPPPPKRRHRQPRLHATAIFYHTSKWIAQDLRTGLARVHLYISRPFRRPFPRQCRPLRSVLRLRVHLRHPDTHHQSHGARTTCQPVPGRCNTETGTVTDTAHVVCSTVWARATSEDLGLSSTPTTTYRRASTASPTETPTCK